jgi:hypothetical protein
MDQGAAPQAAAGDGQPRTGRACRTCRQPAAVAGGDPETAGAVPRHGERKGGGAGHAAAPVIAAMLRAAA